MKKCAGISLPVMVSLFFYIFTALACSKKEMLSQSNETVITKDTMPPTDRVLPATTATYLALGDSYTIGQNVQVTDRFPAQTVKLLQSQSIDIKDPEYIATTGWTTANLLSAINLQNPEKNFDIVTLLIGVNDQYQHRDTAGYFEIFTKVLQKALYLAGGKKSHVFVLSIPDYSVTPFVSNENKLQVSLQIDQFNEINKKITVQNGITYLDITPSTRLAAEDSSLIANDGLHPSAKEYAVWAAMLAPMIKTVLTTD